MPIAELKSSVVRVDCTHLIRGGLQLSSGHRNCGVLLSFPCVLEMKRWINELLPPLWFPKAKKKNMLARIFYSTKIHLCYVSFSVFFILHFYFWQNWLLTQNLMVTSQLQSISNV